jgi:hypothetical protein
MWIDVYINGKRIHIQEGDDIQVDSWGYILINGEYIE